MKTSIARVGVPKRHITVRRESAQPLNIEPDSYQIVLGLPHTQDCFETSLNRRIFPAPIDALIDLIDGGQLLHKSRFDSICVSLFICESHPLHSCGPHAGRTCEESESTRCDTGLLNIGTVRNEHDDTHLPKDTKPDRSPAWA
jgi:hypothetical protein